MENTIALLLEQEILLIEKISRQLDTFYDYKAFNVYSILRRLDSTLHNYIDEVDILDYLNEKGYDFSREECKMALLRLDRDNDGKVNYQELKFLFKTHITAINDKEGKYACNPQEKVSRIKINEKNFTNFNNHNEYDKHYYLNHNNNSNKFKKNIKISNGQIHMITFPKFIQVILNLEIKIEEIKNQLALCTDIVLLELYYLFLQNNNNINKISKNNFQETIKKFNILATQTEIELIFKTYDKDNDDHIDFTEFTKIFLPYDKQYAKLMENKIESEGDQIISNESKILLVKFFTNLILNENTIEANRQKLCNKENFSAYEEFSKIKSIYNNKADFDSLYSFMKEFNLVNNNHSQIYLVFKRFDKDSDGKISFNEFVQEITPKNLIFDI